MYYFIQSITMAVFFKLYKSLLFTLVFITTTTICSMAQYKSYRQLLIFGVGTHDTLIQQQLQLLQEAKEEVEERDLRIITVEKKSKLYETYKVNPGGYAVILVGKDGGEKYRAAELTTANTIFALIDAMPMRRAEIKRKQ